MSTVYLIMGKTLSGKSYLQNLLQTQHQIPKIITATTRPKRHGETDKQDYYFVTTRTADSQIANHEAIAPRRYHVANGQTWTYYLDPNHLYKILKTAPKHAASLILDAQGFVDFITYINDKRHRARFPWLVDLMIVPIYLNVDLKTRLTRYVNGPRHSEDPKEVLRRLYDDEFCAFKRLDNPKFIKKYHIQVISNPQSLRL